MKQNLLGPTLKNLLRTNGLSMAQFGEKIGVSQQTVSGWCTGRTEPTAHYLVLMADTLDVSIDDLVRGNIQADQHDQAQIDAIKEELDEIKAMIAAMLKLQASS